MARAAASSSRPCCRTASTWRAPTPTTRTDGVMIHRFSAVLIGAGLGALAGVWADAPARAQSADLVLCDRVAADPSDPDKPTDVKGVTEVAVSDVTTAIKFCKQAAPSSRRAMFALGRAYAANRQAAEAIAAWRKAADKGSSAA